jgi:hypothetical protein
MSLRACGFRPRTLEECKLTASSIIGADLEILVPKQGGAENVALVPRRLAVSCA